MLTTTNASDASQALPRFVRPTATVAVSGLPRIDVHKIYVCHRYQRRTVPCFGTECSLCSQHIPLDNRIFIPILTLTTARTVVLDLPTSSHTHLERIVAKVKSLRMVTMCWYRSEPFDNGPLAMKAERVTEGDALASVLAGFDDILDRMLAKNVAFWLDHGLTDNTAATALRLVRDRRLA